VGRAEGTARLLEGEEKGAVSKDISEGLCGCVCGFAAQMFEVATEVSEEVR